MNLKDIAEKTAKAIFKQRRLAEKAERLRLAEEARKHKEIEKTKKNLCARFRLTRRCDKLCPFAQIKVSGSGDYECATCHDRDFSTDFLYNAITTDGWRPPEDWKYQSDREACTKFYEEATK